VSRPHADGINLRIAGVTAEGPAIADFWTFIRLSPTIRRTNVPKWEKSSATVSKLLAETTLSIYFFEENSFVAFTTLSHCSENEKPLTPAKVTVYSGARW
jgi:hypothetical protein